MATTTELEELRRRNAELEKQLREGREREDRLSRELERTRERLLAVEEAEERLCGDLTELEAEAVEQAREYLMHVKALSEQLELARAIHSSTRLSHLVEMAGSR